MVAIDGPAGSGKSTTARAVAEALGYAHLDSGALYRAVTLVALESGQGPPAWRGERLAEIARERGVTLELPGPAGAGTWEVRVGSGPAGDALREERVTRNVSEVSAMPPVRDYVNAILRRAAAGGGVVLDGRDIGTVVFPDADVKVFMVADADERARRRLAERGRAVDAGAVAGEAAALTLRDQRDSTRATAPLARAPDAVTLDTTRMSFAEQVGAVVELVRRVAASLDPAGGAR